MNDGDPPTALHGPLANEVYAELVNTAADVIAAEVETQLSRHLWISHEKLKVANEGLQKFTAIVAHDLRGPLRRIEAFVDVLQKDFRPALDAEGADILDRISSGAGRMRLMLDALLQYSRYSSAAIVGKFANLNDVIHDAVSVFDWKALGASNRIEVNDAAEVSGDPLLLSHVLQNLVGNAVKFRANRPLTINVEVYRLDGEVAVAVIDNGIGIESRFSEKIFDMFYRLHDEDEYEGTGIGLTICRKIINDHGGRIWLDTGYRGGTKFVFTLKAAGRMDLEDAAERPRVQFLAAPLRSGERSGALNPRPEQETADAARPYARGRS